MDGQTGGQPIGEVAARTGLTERTLRYYEELGLISPTRDHGGRRRYDTATLDRLYRLRVQRELGVPLGAIDLDDGDLLSMAGRHLDDIDRRLTALTRQRERVRAVEERLLSGDRPGDEALLDLLTGMGDDEVALTRRIALLVYRDVAAAHAWLVETFGLRPGPVHRQDGRAHLGVLHAGDGVIWLHEESERARFASPLATVGRVTASVVVEVDDIDAHHARALAAGVDVDHPPVDQPYGVREYSARDLEGQYWSFHQPDPGEDPPR